MASVVFRLTLFIAFVSTFYSSLLSAQTTERTQSKPEALPTVTPPALTLEALQQMALDRNPTLVQAAAQVRISRGKAMQAGLYPNPTVGYTAEQIGADGTAGELQGGFVQQEIVTRGKLGLSRAKFQQEVVQAEAQFEAQQFRIITSVRKAFYHTLATQRQIEVRQELLGNAEDALQTTKSLLNVGQANRPDLLQAEVQVHRARAALRAAERHYQGRWRELAAYVGVPNLDKTPLSGNLEIAEDEVLDADTIIQQLINCSPQLRAARAEVARDRIGVQRERNEPFPNLQLRVETGYNYETRNTVAGASVGVKLPIWDKNQGTIAQAQAELARAEAEISRIELMLYRKFGETFADYEAALAEARILEQDVLPKTRETYETYREAFEKRRAAWPQVLVAQREYFQFTDEYIDTLLAVRRAEAEINGFFLGDGLDQPTAPTPEGHRDATPRPR